jgi:hypothetical protein
LFTKKNKKNMTQEQIFGIIRHTLTLAGGVLIAKGLVDDASWTEITGSALSLVAVVWSVVSKKK